MALIFKLACNRCDWQLGPTDGGHLYAILDDGTRKALPHPAEFATALEATGKELDQLQKERRIGTELQFLCLECATDTYLDPKADNKECSDCGSTTLVEVGDAKDQICPSCGTGRLAQEHIGIS